MLKLDRDIMIGMHRGELSPAEAMHAQTERDELHADPRPANWTPPPISAYTPYSHTGDLGAEYNRIMARLAPDEWAIFLDHDVTILTLDTWDLILDAIARHPDAGAITCWTNRIGCPRQRAKGTPDGNDIAAHMQYACKLQAKNGSRTKDITGPEMGGFLFATSKRTWERVAGFRHGFGEVDNDYARRIQAAGLRLYRIEGLYVLHTRLTNGWRDGTPRQTDCARTSWLWAHAYPIMRATAPPPIQDMLDAHDRLVESRTDWSACKKNARRRSRLREWKTTMRTTLIIPARDEPIDHVRTTIRTFREHGADHIILVDDASATEASQSPYAPLADDVDRLLINPQPMGPAWCRNRGAQLAPPHTDVFLWSDCHVKCRSDIRDFAFQALATPHILNAVTGSWDSDSRYYGSELRWARHRYDHTANRRRTEYPSMLFGSVYALSRRTFDLVGGWPPTWGFGYNEQALSLACHFANIPIRIDYATLCEHRFRNGGGFPYPCSGATAAANVVLAHWLLFGPDTFDRIFRPQFAAHSPRALADAMDRIEADGDRLAAIRTHYHTLKRVTDADILARFPVPGGPE